jgi:signal recognition particle subunit SRP54
MEKIGGIGGMLGMLPGVAKMKSQLENANLDDRSSSASAPSSTR